MKMRRAVCAAAMGIFIRPVPNSMTERKRKEKEWSDQYGQWAQLTANKGKMPYYK